MMISRPRSPAVSLGSLQQQQQVNRRSGSAPSLKRKAPPYAERVSTNPRIDAGFGPDPKAASPLAGYSALCDPHLVEYFDRKFASAAGCAVQVCSTKREFGRHGEAEHIGLRPRSRSEALIRRDFTYKVSVTTSDANGSGTDAPVYFAMRGTLGLMPRRRLAKKTSTAKRARFRFSRGSTQTFRFNLPDLGDLESVSIEHTGIEERDSWLLQSIEVTNLQTKRSWMFLNNHWLSLYKEDGQTCRELFAVRCTKTSYEVVVVTGDQEGAGTDSQAFITIYGRTGITRKLALKTPDNENPVFRRNSTQRFVLNAPCVGPLKKIRIQHDESGRSTDWFLDRVVVSDLKHPKWKYHFACGQWLSRRHGDGQVVCELAGGKDPTSVPKATTFRVTAFTANKPGAGTDADVFIKLFGESGVSNDYQLKVPVSNKKPFGRGQVDEFMCKGRQLGPLSKVRIWHNNLGFAASWYLDKLIIDDLALSKVYEVPCYQWFSQSEGDHKLCRDLPVRSGGSGLGPYKEGSDVSYDIRVKTSDRKNAGTSARVYIVLHRDSKKAKKPKRSDKIWLKSGKFDRGSIDRFAITLQDMLSPVTKLDIGQDNSGVGPGWHLESVVIYCPMTGIEQTFVCKEWLNTENGCERTLIEDKSLRKQRDQQEEWAVEVHTGNKQSAGTDARVFLALYGDKGKSDEIFLDSVRGSFERGKVDSFKIHTPLVGTPFKVRIGHDNSGAAAGWFLERLLMRRTADGSDDAGFEFQCGRWLAESEDDKCIVRELPAEGKGIRSVLSVHKYHVLVKTGKVRYAGTDANVYCDLFGSKSDTGNRALKYSSSHKNPFEKGNEDEFVLEAVGLGKRIDKVRIGHDGKNAGSGWYLDKVTVWREDQPDNKFEFICDRWLDSKEDDGCIERDLTASGTLLDKLTYNVSVKTGDVSGAGTDANVFLNIFGDKGETGERQLKASEAAFNKFERNRTDLFRIESPDIGKLERIRIRHDGSNPNAGWFLDWVRIAVPSQGKQYNFAAHRWLDTNEADRKLEVDIDLSEVTDIEHTIPYEIIVQTGNCQGAGTDANVFVQIYGEDGLKTEQTPLRSRSDTFEKGKLEKFKLDLLDVGPIQKLRIGHDGTGFGDGWFLDHVIIRRHAMKGSKRLRASLANAGRRRKSKQAPGYDRRAEDDGDEDADYGDFQSRRASSASGPSSRQRPRSAAGRGSLRAGGRGGKRDKRVDDYDDEDDFNDGYDDDRWSDDRSRKGRRGTTASSSRSPSAAGSTRHRQSVRSAAGGSSRRGSRYASDDDDENYDEEFDDSADNFDDRRSVQSRRASSAAASRRRSSVRSPSVSGPRRGGGKNNYDIDEDDQDDADNFDARTRVDGGEDDGEEEVVEEYWFYCNRWLARDEDDKLIVRELLPTTKDGKPLSRLSELVYEVRVQTGDKLGAGTDANVFLTLFGSEADSGERELSSSETHRNKFERKNEDIFKLKAVDLGELRKVKIRHDDKGGGADWYLDHVIVLDPKAKREVYFPCHQWLSTSRDGGHISRDLLAVDKSHMGKDVHEKLKLEKKAASETYHVKIYTGDVYGAGTDANCHIVLFGDSGDSGVVPLQRSKTYSDKFERGHCDEFEIELVDIGELKKIKLGHDNSNPRPDWYVEKVEIDCPKLGTSWLFNVGEWIGKSKGDGQLEKTLYPQQGATRIYANRVPYEITTYTSDKSSAGTSANVFIQIYGRETQTEQKLLCSKTDRSGKFKRGSVDKFVLELEDVDDPIEKIRIGHDDEGLRSGWHLDKVEIRKFIEGKTSVTYVFPCGHWLARDEEDHEIVRELVPSKVIEEDDRIGGKGKRREKDMKGSLKKKTYKVHVFTGDKSGAGTNADVFLTVFGEKGDTGERELINSETYTDKFEKGHEDIFTWEAVDLGKLYKIKIRHNDKGFFSDWFLDHVEVHDTATGEKTSFFAERWLSKKKEDKKLQVTVYAQGYEGDMASSASSMRSLGSNLSGVERDKSPRGSLRRASSTLEKIAEGPTGDYNITFTTGRAKGGTATEGPIWVRLYGYQPPTKESSIGRRQSLSAASSSSSRRQKRGEEVNTGQVDLPLEGTDKALLPGSTVQFSFEALKLEEVTRLEIGNEGIVSGKGWYLEEFRLELPVQGKLYTQKCKCWFAKDKEDSKTVRMFEFSKDDGDSIVSFKPKVPYEVQVETANEKDAGTDCRVMLTVYGQQGHSEPVYLDKEETRFERGRRDLIKVYIEDVGQVHKIRLGHDGKGHRKKWLVDRVTLTNTDTAELYTFECGQCIGKDGKNYVDLEARVNNKSVLSKVKYRVTVKTSEDRGAGTDAKVFVRLFGELGDSGELRLKKAVSENRRPFQAGQKDEFEFELLDLGGLFRCVVWHDDTGLGSDWKLDSITVEDVRKKRSYEFPCGKWLSLSKDDRVIKRDLVCDVPEGERREESGRKVTYEIAVTTSDKAEAGMSHNAWIMLDGDTDSMNREFLMENSRDRRVFQRGDTDTFKLKTRNLGRLRTLHIGAVEQEGRSVRQEAGKKARWHVFQVLVTDTAKGTEYRFPVNSWIPIKPKLRRDDGLEVEAEDFKETGTKGRLAKQRELNVIKYEVEVETGDEFGSGTNADVSLNIFGEFGELGVTPLKMKGRDLFERNQVDKFTIESRDLGELKKIRIEHNDSGFRSDWLLAKVTVKDSSSGKVWVFNCNQWLSKKKGDKQIFKELYPTQG
ncbi:hypothetical protein BOX15_Mlig008366g2 [Macrostomum lignano]|uniref:PLAT domain-containing protein n=1 Tax=Macrostomum lignano TaxID=282301 RepID=A0A267G220_9PLAT|nr:hypothetical protein BOX15_Mlig008366g2 [Macrostomum lignano]